MAQKHVQRRSQSASSVEQRRRRSPEKPARERRNSAFVELRTQDSYSAHTWLSSLIEQNAPLKGQSALVLMYGPFQAEMQPENGQGVASWLRECIRKHGLPSLVRFDYRQRAQVFRRDQFQPWLEPLLNRKAS